MSQTYKIDLKRMDEFMQSLGFEMQSLLFETGSAMKNKLESFAALEGGKVSSLYSLQDKDNSNISFKCFIVEAKKLFILGRENNSFIGANNSFLTTLENDITCNTNEDLKKIINEKIEKLKADVKKTANPINPNASNDESNDDTKCNTQTNTSSNNKDTSSDFADKWMKKGVARCGIIFGLAFIAFAAIAALMYAEILVATSYIVTAIVVTSVLALTACCALGHNQLKEGGKL